MSGQTTDPGNRSAAEIERDVETTRARVSGTLEELREKASPGQLFEQALDYARHSGGPDFARNLGQSIRDNPIPVLLIGAGIGWLMMAGPSSGGNGQGWRHDRDVRTRRGGTAHAGAPQRDDNLSSAARGVGAAAGRAASAASEAAAGGSAAVGSAYEGVAHGAARLRETAGDVADAAAGTLRDAREVATENLAWAREETRRGLHWLTDEQPLVLGAVGLAVGAALGAILPGTEAENRLMGEARDDLVSRGTEAVEEGYRQAKEAVSEEVERARERIGEGEVASGLAEAARNLAEKARDAVPAAEDGAPQDAPRRPEDRPPASRP